MHWLCFPVCLFNIEIGELETGKAISRSELGLLPANGSCLRETGSCSALGLAFTSPPVNRGGSLTTTTKYAQKIARLKEAMISLFMSVSHVIVYHFIIAPSAIVEPARVLPVC
jgi:hypothetical protein